jgi:hypothetical protein
MKSATGLSGTKFSTLKSARIYDPEETEQNHSYFIFSTLTFIVKKHLAFCLNFDMTNTEILNIIWGMV